MTLIAASPRAIGTLLRLSVCLSVRRRLWRYVLWLNGAS